MNSQEKTISQWDFREKQFDLALKEGEESSFDILNDALYIDTARHYLNEALLNRNNSDFNFSNALQAFVNKFLQYINK